MRLLPALLLPLLLNACAGPLPSPDPRQAWVELYATSGRLLMADRLDGQRLNDGRYFQVSPGRHELQLRFQHEVSGGGRDPLAEPLQITCILRVRYHGFAAGQRYRLEARPLGMRAAAWLYDSQRRVVAEGEILRCPAL